MAMAKLLVAAVIVLALPGLSLAATCEGSPLNPQIKVTCVSREAQYAARQAYCSRDLWRTTGCFVQGDVRISFSNPGNNNRQICWDALENIIQQCGASNAKGTYNYNGVYALSRCGTYYGAC